jgi:phospho-N-acetylmuramoyl-pentapeptide-transferase
VILDSFEFFNYITFRAVMATLTALGIGLVFGPWVIRRLTILKVGQAVRTDGPKTHLIKSGTPTMGGVLILIGVAISTLLWSDLSNRFIWAVLWVTLGFGIVGWVDDYRKVVYKNPKGMSLNEKYFWQSLIGILAAIYLVFAITDHSNQGIVKNILQWKNDGYSFHILDNLNLVVPFFKSVNYPLGTIGFVDLRT